MSRSDPSERVVKRIDLETAVLPEHQESLRVQARELELKLAGLLNAQ